MQVFDITVQAMANRGLMVLLNNHNSEAGWCCSPDQEGSLWDTVEYPTELWSECLSKMAARYKHIPLVCGMDIRNEVRDRMINGVTLRELMWTDTPHQNNWKIAAEDVGLQILEKDPAMLVIVSGVCYGLDVSFLFLYVAYIPPSMYVCMNMCGLGDIATHSCMYACMCVTWEVYPSFYSNCVYLYKYAS